MCAVNAFILVFMEVIWMKNCKKLLSALMAVLLLLTLIPGTASAALEPLPFTEFGYDIDSLRFKTVDECDMGIYDLNTHARLAWVNIHGQNI